MRGFTFSVVYFDEFMFSPLEIHLGIEAQIMQANRVGFYFSSPNKKECWGKEVMARKDKTVRPIHVSNVCVECQALPDVKKIKCTHRIVDQGGNLRKSKMNRKRKMETTTDIQDTLTDLMGDIKMEPEPYYNRDYVRRVMDENHVCKIDPTWRVPFHLLFFDPNAGGTDHCAMTGLFFIGGRFIITLLHTSPVKQYAKFLGFVFDSLAIYHTKIRNGNICEPIILAVETVKSWDGDTFLKELNMRVNMGQSNFQNIHLLADESKNKSRHDYEPERHGTTLSERRKTNMSGHMMAALEYDSILTHPDLCTPSTWGIDNIKLIWIDQMSHWRHTSVKDSSFPGANGTIGGKEEGRRIDDLALSTHSALGWYWEIQRNPFYDYQKLEWFRFSK